ncbi:hypothetical protein B0H13DRAFT_1979514, partial [Mycena leptocephala]
MLTLLRLPATPSNSFCSLSHYRPIREEDVRLCGLLRTVKDSGLKVGRKVCHGLGANRSGDCIFNAFPSRRAVSSSNQSGVLGCSSHPPRFEPRSGALASTACAHICYFAVGIESVGTDIRPRSTHAVLPPSRSGTQPASSSHLRRASRPPTLSANAKSPNSTAASTGRAATEEWALGAEGVERERGELEGHIACLVLASWP